MFICSSNPLAPKILVAVVSKHMAVDVVMCHPGPPKN